MVCNCKKKAAIESKYGEPIEQTWFDKLYTIGLKIVGFIIMLLIAIVLVPIVLVVAIYKMFFSKNKAIVLPEFLGKYLR